ncbi:uncharacterized protein LOC108697900 isoform X2 [Xenopus laevis]|uniref:FXYD domain-containing ion transport regulator n=1 Tax=Xenopus laevis TaxID=8355 RepID=A0A8J1LE07_XENLA|nr:uncharacterized protein LOC108697900 isoform X2 [Xenopus laevis]
MQSLLLLFVTQLLIQGPLPTHCVTESTLSSSWTETLATSEPTLSNGSEPNVQENVPVSENKENSSIGSENVTAGTQPQDPVAEGVTTTEPRIGVTDLTNEGVTTKQPRTMKTNPTSKDTRRQKGHDKTLFTYDYYSLRQWGLVCALILFVLGILVLVSDKCPRCSCRRRQKRKYNVTFE